MSERTTEQVLARGSVRTVVQLLWGFGGGPDPALVARILATREPAWRAAFFDAVWADRWGGAAWLRELAYELSRGEPRPSSAEYVAWYARRMLGAPDDIEFSGRGAVSFSAEYERFLEHDLWQAFRVEGALDVGQWGYPHRALADSQPTMRARLLDETLSALSLGFSVYNSAPHILLHTALEPTPEETASRQHAHLALLAAANLPTVSFAQAHLASLLDAGGLDAERVIAASALVFARTDKKSVLAQTKMLEGLAARRPELAPAVARALAPLLDSQRKDVAERARRSIARLDPAAEIEQPAPSASGTTVAVPPPRIRPLASSRTEAAPVADVEELATLVTALLEYPAPAGNLVRAVEGMLALRDQRPLAAGALAKRAARLFQLNPGGMTSLVPRVVLSWLDPALERIEGYPVESFPTFPVNHKFTQESSPSLRARYTTEFAPGRPRRPRWEEQHYAGSARLVQELSAEAVSSTTLFALWLEDAARALRSGRAPGPVVSAVRRVSAGFPPHPPRWERSAGGFDFPDGQFVSWPMPGVPRLTWLDLDAQPATTRTPHLVPFDLGELRAEFFHRIDIARWERQHEAAVDWWTRLYAGSIDHLAAQSHPVLSGAVEHINVGTAPVVDAIGATTQLPGAPAWSALALALSDKSPDGRARAAEAFAGLAARGLLDSDAFAEQLAAVLHDGFGMASRIAVALGDAAGISAIAGWRVLEVLTACLPVVAGANGGAQLVALAARLAPDYGVAVEVPSALAAKSRGSGPMAVAVRSLLAGTACETALALTAAGEAAAALDLPDGAPPHYDAAPPVEGATARWPRWIRPRRA